MKIIAIVNALNQAIEQNAKLRSQNLHNHVALKLSAHYHDLEIQARNILSLVEKLEPDTEAPKHSDIIMALDQLTAWLEEEVQRQNEVRKSTGLTDISAKCDALIEQATSVHRRLKQIITGSKLGKIRCAMCDEIIVPGEPYYMTNSHTFCHTNQCGPRNSEPLDIRTILGRIEQRINEPFITARFGDKWLEYAKNMPHDVVCAIAWIQGRRAILLERELEKICK